MAGCTKANRKRNSPHNKRYKGANKWEINKKKRMAREAKKQKLRSEKPLKVPRGTARRKRRVLLQQQHKVVLAFN